MHFDLNFLLKFSFRLGAKFKFFKVAVKKRIAQVLSVSEIHADILSLSFNFKEPPHAKRDLMAFHIKLRNRASKFDVAVW